MHSNIILIQKIVRGYITRKKLKSLKDSMNLDILNNLLDNYIDNFNKLKEINKKLSNKKCRNENFPSHISENIAKFAIYKKYGIMPNWDTEKGDLVILEKQIEVKGFMSDGPSSFGPTENWNWIYFVDAKDFLKKNFKIYEIKLSNKNNIWKNIILSGEDFDNKNISKLPDNLEKLSIKELNELCKERKILQGKSKKTTIKNLQTKLPGSKINCPETYGKIVEQNARGKLRGSFYTIFKPQLDSHCKLIFDGNISNLSKIDSNNLDKLTNKIKNIII
jgi:hypothetical protein